MVIKYIYVYMKLTRRRIRKKTSRVKRQKVGDILYLFRKNIRKLFYYFLYD